VLKLETETILILWGQQYQRPAFLGQLQEHRLQESQLVRHAPQVHILYNTVQQVMHHHVHHAMQGHIVPLSAQQRHQVVLLHVLQAVLLVLCAPLDLSINTEELLRAALVLDLTYVPLDTAVQVV